MPRVSELLLHRCCLQGVTASDRRGSAVNSTPKIIIWVFFLLCESLCCLVCLFPNCHSVPIINPSFHLYSLCFAFFFPLLSPDGPLYYVSRISTAPCCPPHPTEIFPPRSPLRSPTIPMTTLSVPNQSYITGMGF